MRINHLALVLLPLGAAAFAPRPKVHQTVSLEAGKQDFVKPFIGAFAGMTLASQVAFAAVSPLPEGAYYKYQREGGFCV
jgi:hypothetical protein